MSDARCTTQPGTSDRSRSDAERQSIDDQATTLAALGLQDALARHQARSADEANRHRPGTCTNCSAPCAGQAVYCDPACRADDEKRQQAQRRRGGGR